MCFRKKLGPRENCALTRLKTHTLVIKHSICE